MRKIVTDYTSEYGTFPPDLVYTNIFIQDYTIAKYILIKGAFLYRLVTVKKDTG